MKLRTRLIVAFLVLSVVPLGAVTWYSYRNNVEALRDAASREADVLAEGMTDRMRLVTSELSSGLERLAMNDMNDTNDVVRTSQPRKADARQATPAPVASDASVGVVPVSSPAAAVEVTNEAKIAAMLGEAAMLLQSVELRGMRGLSGGRGRPRPDDPNAPAGSRSRGPEPPPGGAAGTGQSRPATDPRIVKVNPVGRGGSAPDPRAGGTGTSDGSLPPRFGPPTFDRGRNAQRAPVTMAPPSPSAPTSPSVPVPVPPGPTPKPGARALPVLPATSGLPTVAAPASPPAAIANPDRIVIDMGSITRDMLQKILPEGGFENMTPEQRQRVAREVNQRVMGIAEGIRISAAELQKKANVAKEKAAADTKLAVTKPPAARAAPSEPQATAAKRTSALTGNRLDVTIEQDGKVMRQVNAEINLDTVLATVFSPTRREKGEVPFAVAKDGRVYTANDEDRRTVEDLGFVARPDGPLGTTVLPDWLVVTTADPSGSGLRFGIARPVGDSLDALRRTAGRNAGLGLLFIGLAFVGVVPLSRSLTRNLSTLTAGVDRISHGDYAARVDVKARDEIGDLARAFNQMAADVERHQAEKVGQERIRRELELGRQIQNEMLPHGPLKLGLTEIQGVSIPAREVGGDFFNYFVLDNGDIAMLVGDVSGKGVGAALLMANVQASLRTRLGMGQDLAAIADAIDREIDATTPASVYATLFMGILSPGPRVLRYLNAGHHPQYAIRAGGKLERMESSGLPVGMLSGRGYKEGSVQLAAGDLIFFYTDGCVEAENAVGDMFGPERLEPLLMSIGPTSPEQVLQLVEREVTTFRGETEPFDDATMMAVRVG